MATIFQSLTAQGQPSAAANRKKHLVEFRAGKLARAEGNWVRPDTRKGQVYMDVGDDALLHFCWKDRTTNRVEDDLIIFPEEAEFSRVTQSNSRVYVLAFKSSSQKHFFWMQEPKADKDDELVTLVNKAIDDPASVQQQQAAGPGSPSAAAAEQAQLLQMLQQMGTGSSASQRPASPSRAAAPRATSPSRTSATSPTRAPAAAAVPAAAAAPTAQQMDQLRSILAGIQLPASAAQQQPDASLSSILSVDTLRPILQDPQARAALFPHLPASAAHTEAELEATLRSPQFKQAVQTLTFAVRSGHVATILTSMGLDAGAAGGTVGVEALVRAVGAAAKKKKGEEQGNDEDRMDTS